MSGQTEPIEIPPDLCTQLLDEVARNPLCSHVRFLRDRGLQGSRGQIRAAVYRQLADEIAEARGDTIRREIARRAIDGWDEPVWHQGAEVGVIRKFSDRLLEFMGRMYLPEAREQVDVNVAGANGGPVRVEVDGARVTGIGAVFELAHRLGVAGAPTGLSAAAARGTLPAPPVVLPDPPDG